MAAARPPQYVGARVPRVEDPRFLAGGHGYLDDITRPGLLHAAFVRSPHAHARIRSVDTTEAAAVPGVVGVFTADDLQGVQPIVTALDRPEATPVSRSALAKDKVRFVGDVVAVVVARSRYLAEDGADLVDVDYEPLPAVLDAEKALAADAPVLDEELGHNNFIHTEDSAGDVEQAFADAAHVFAKRFRVGRSAGAPLETRGTMADYDVASGRLTVWCSTQLPHLLRTFLAPTIGVSEGKLTVISPDLGGGFGTKAHINFPDEVIIPALSRQLRRPVKWIEDRYESLAASVHSKELIGDIEIAVDADGTFRAFRGRFIGNSGAYAVVPWSGMVDPACAATMLPSIYDVRNVAWSADTVLTNKCPTGAVRGVGWTPGQLIRESLIEDVARALEIDPVELRVKNAIGPEPYVTALGARYDGGSYVESMRVAQKAIDYENTRRRQQELRGQGRYLGIGFSPFVEPTGFASKGAHQVGYPIHFHDQTSVTMEPDGSVTVKTGMHSHGQGHETTFAQVVADRLGVRLDDVRVVRGDTDHSPYGMGTYASRSAVIANGALSYAAADVRAKLVRLASVLLEASPDDIELHDGQASVRGVPGQAVPLASVAGFGYFGPKEVVAADGTEPALTATRTYDPEENYANGTCAVVLEVDPELGTIRIERIVAVEDCGVMLNPTIVEGQISGAIAQALGLTLLEEAAYADDGNFLAGSLMDYLYPTAADVPEITMEHIETPSAVTESGVKGVGEAGTVSAPAAVVNAITDALAPFGVTVDRTPVTPSYIRDLIRGATT
ncbi:xanthine dehydrogenase family protein molybdopterin-binding subunit [Pseudonocardia sp. C8]|nr:xanthine dehydrogenase family protein molybdopterin-binding subunit [Pseudonocardia sp. C8]